jgi:hypothetical protein
MESVIAMFNITYRRRRETETIDVKTVVFLSDEKRLYHGSPRRMPRDASQA